MDLESKGKRMDGRLGVMRRLHPLTPSVLIIC